MCPLHIDCDLEKGMKSVCSQRGGVQCESKNVYSVSQKTPWGFLAFFPKQLGIFYPFLHAYYTFLSTLDYNFLFNSLQLWRSYAILSATTQFTSYAQCPPSAETDASDVCKSRWWLCWSLPVASHHRSAAVHFLALGWSFALTEVCEMLEASHTTHRSRVGWVRSGEW